MSRRNREATVPRITRFPADYDYDYDYDRSGASAANVMPLGDDDFKPGDKEQWPLLAPSEFPRRYWDPTLYALVVVAEFADTGWKEGPHSVDPGPPDDIGSDKVKKELNRLAAYGVDDRAAHLGEILSQRANMAAYWLNLLMFNQCSHPATIDIVNIALRVGQFAAMHFKFKYKRPRPSQVDPRIFPLIVVPGHASYPSGHATEGTLLSLCLADIVPEATLPLQKLALRVATNRERAGVHYRNDSEAGERLAKACFERLKTCPSFKEAMGAARAEWSRDARSERR
jgi:hypothetical protein